MFKKTIIISTLILSTGVGYYLFSTGKKTSPLTSNEVIEIINTLKFEWEHARLDSENKCKKLSYVDEQYYQCFPEYMQCLLENKLVKVQIDGRLTPLEAKRSYSYHQMPTYRYYDFVISPEGKSQKLQLSFVDSCQEIYVPQRYYPFMANKRAATISWDNFNRDIFVDKFLITNREVNEWIDTMGLSIEKKLPPERPSAFLSLEEMENFCAFKGKRLASAQVVEAASFYPSGSSDRAGRTLIRYDYPWTRRNSDTFLYKLKKDSELLLTKFDCEKAYVRNCFEITPFITHMTKSSSWSGIFQIMGGPFEAYSNRLESKRNLRASSFYFPVESDVHVLGEKLFWDGLAHLDKNIDWLKDKPVGVDGRSLEIGFRCMRNAYE